MKRVIFRILAGALFLSNITITNSFADEALAKDEELSVLKGQVQELMKRIEKLEAEQLSAKEESRKATDELKK